ncbi:MAG: carotenoid 1,2-hydratase [Gammaproteobacteria bacterium]|nr:carotenoid 1,2-hydratase [Gammaproteobacteria bacterium]
MAAEPDPGFARAVSPRAFEFPGDHGPHRDYATEWWYLTGNLDTPEKRRFGYQLTLFRIGLVPGEPATDSGWRTTQVYMGHLAVSDIDARRHHSAERFSRAASGLAGARSEPLAVWLGPWQINGETATTFPLRVLADTPGFGLSLEIGRGAKPIVLQGDKGLSQKSGAAGNASYYYSMTRLPTLGQIRIAERHFEVAGNSWFDREWSSSALGPDQAGWDWFALQLDDGRDLMFYRMRGLDGEAQAFSNGVVVDRDGAVHRLQLGDVQLQATRTWSSHDGTSYPVSWHLRIPAHALDLQVRAAFDEQEMRHTVRYWEGAVEVTGSHRGRGYLELSGYAD